MSGSEQDQMHLRVCLVATGVVPAHGFLAYRPFHLSRTPFNTARPIMSAAGHGEKAHMFVEKFEFHAC